MWYKILLFLIYILFIVAIQVAFLGSFSNYISGFNIVLSSLVFMLFILNFRWVVFFVISTGFLLDIYSSLPFGIFMISLFITAFTLEILLTSFFTNRSFYSVMLLGGVSVLLFNIIFLIITGLTYLIGVNNFYINSSYLIGIIYQIINVLVILAVLFFLANYFSRTFKPNFIR